MDASIMTISDTISSYRKRRKVPTSFVIGAIALVLVLIGVVVLVIGFSGGGGFHLFATKTPTPTITPTPTNTSTPTATATITLTPTTTFTATPAAPYQYVIQEGDYLYTIASSHDLGDDGVVMILLLNPYDEESGTGIDPNNPVIFTGQTIWLPPPNMPLPTATPLPTGITPGTRITYFVLPGDSLGGIAAKMNSTVEAIINANPDLLADGEATVIYQGWLLQVPVNIATAVPTSIPTATPIGTASPSPTATP